MPILMTFRATLAVNWFGLLGEIDDPHPALADLIEDPVRADLFRLRRVDPVPRRRAGARRGSGGVSLVSHGTMTPRGECAR